MTGEAPKSKSCKPSGPLGLYRELLELSSPEDFAKAVLDFDPFAILNKSYCDVSAMGCAMLGRLLKKALERLGKPEVSPKDTDGWGDLNLATDGWDDLDLTVEGVDAPVPAQSEPTQDLLRRLTSQLRRLQVLDALLQDADKGDRTDSIPSVTWKEFREMDDESLCKLSCILAAKQLTLALEALFMQEEKFMKSNWQIILEALPETAEIRDVKRLLPVSAEASTSALLKVDNATDWYLERALKIVSRTGLCRIAAWLKQDPEVQTEPQDVKKNFWFCV